MSPPAHSEAVRGSEEPRARREVGLRLIVGYKVVKAAIEVACGMALVLFSTRATDELRSIAIHFREHATAAWSILLAEKVIQVATPRHLFVAAVASLLDGVLTSIEGWALHTRRRWGAWLVVVTTSGFLPFEVVSLAHRVTAGRVALLVVNAGILAYLIRRESSKHAR
jgi:uncharacterized membrane protein (DUF2068 family)